MRRLILFLLPVVIFMSATAAATAVAPAAAGGKYVIGGVKGVLKDSGGGGGSMIAEMVKSLAGVVDEDIDIKWYEDFDKLVEAAVKGEVDFTAVFEYTPTLSILSQADFKPLIGYTLLGMDETRACFFYRTGMEVKSVEDFKGADLVAYSTDFEYYLLRDFIGEKPEDYFGKLIKSPSGVASIYDVAVEGNNKLMFVYEQNMFLVKMSNPNALKKIRRLECTDPIPFYPLLHSGKVPEEVVKKFRKFFINAYNEESIKRFMPLMRQFKIKFKPVTREELEPEIELYKKAMKEGWDKDFRKWVDSAPMIEKQKKK